MAPPSATIFYVVQEVADPHPYITEDMLLPFFPPGTHFIQITLVEGAIEEGFTFFQDGKTDIVVHLSNNGLWVVNYGNNKPLTDLEFTDGVYHQLDTGYLVRKPDHYELYPYHQPQLTATGTNAEG